MIGKQLSHYRVLQKIGEGGMGEVYLAEDVNLMRKAAVKVLSQKTGYKEEFKRRFKLEAQAVAALNHPNIVTIYELGEDNDTPFIVMEYVDGRSLREILHKRSKLSLDEALNYACQVCEGLTKAHFAGIIHRDIKPENILIDKEDRVKILDFGLAKLRGSSSNITRESTRVGTLKYMSPEQVQGQELDPRSDIFSLGIILYELLTGHIPFKGDYDVAILYSISHDPPVPLRERLSDAPEVLEQIIEKALKKDPARRFQTVGEMQDELIRVRQGRAEGRGQESSLNSPSKGIEELLEHREKIDKLIETRYKREVVIMFADIAGSTQFFEKRGDIEGRAMVQRFNRLMFPIIEDHQGAVIKTMGDGIMASFGDPVAACRCAVSMQQLLFTDNSARVEDDQIAMRVALHFGRGVIEKGDVYGDVVNVAARVEKHTEAGTIVMSQSLYEKVENDEAFRCGYQGTFSVKGKSEPLALYRLSWRTDESADTPDEGAKTIAAEHGEASPPPPPPAKTESSYEEVVQPGFRLTRPYKTPPAPDAETRHDAMHGNPYMNRVMIRNADEFYGREPEVRKIYARIGSSRPQSVSVVGERRIGKSSLLHYVYSHENRRHFLLNADEYVMVFVDFQEKRGIGIPEFFKTIQENLLKEFRGTFTINLDPGYETFKRTVGFLEEQELKLVLVFDEFELVTRNDRFDAEFYSFLRSMANNHNVAYLVASGRNLQTMCHSREISDSPFFNIFSNLTLSQFTHKEAAELITEPARKAGVNLEAEVPFVIDLAGYHPFFIQMVCASLFEYVRDKRPLDKEVKNNVQEEFLDEARVHFQQIWEVCDEDTREIMLLLAQGKKPDPSREYLAQELSKAGYIREEKGKPLLFSSLFADYISERYLPGGKKKKRRFWPF